MNTYELIVKNLVFIEKDKTKLLYIHDDKNSEMCQNVIQICLEQLKERKSINNCSNYMKHLKGLKDIQNHHKM